MNECVWIHLHTAFRTVMYHSIYTHGVDMEFFLDCKYLARWINPGWSFSANTSGLEFSLTEPIMCWLKKPRWHDAVLPAL